MKVPRPAYYRKFQRMPLKYPNWVVTETLVCCFCFNKNIFFRIAEIVQEMVLDFMIIIKWVNL